MMDVVLRELTVRDLLPAQALLTAALPYDRSDVVTAEKLLASNFRRDRFSVGAFSPDGELLGVMAQAGRWIKLLAVKPAVQRRGIGSATVTRREGTSGSDDGNSDGSVDEAAGGRSSR
jgi:ribosomal protein S18 acetylase RimI-like enzyme